jgi:hypothetical protein
MGEFRRAHHPPESIVGPARPRGVSASGGNSQGWLAVVSGGQRAMSQTMRTSNKTPPAANA